MLYVFFTVLTGRPVPAAAAVIGMRHEIDDDQRFRQLREARLLFHGLLSGVSE
jgi:hypothetical protein